MNKIKFVYFDLGGVVIFDFSGTNKWKELKNELGFFGEKEKEFDDVWFEHEPNIVLGKMEVDDLLPIYRKKFGVIIPDDYSLLINGFVNRFEENKKIFPLIEKFKKAFKIGLLTNSYTGMLNTIEKRGIMPKVEWNKIVDSSVVSLRKPDNKIYYLAENMADARGEEILFIDNTLKNLDAARKSRGWQTFYYDSSNVNESNKKLSDFWDTLNIRKG